ncbi:MAG: carboxypeptidase regulatory-like domain-containing protein [Bryobacteraceae bacterium]
MANRLRNRNVTRAAALLTVLVALAGIAPAYYFNVYFAGQQGPFTPVPVRFDLGSLPGKTVYYFVSDDGPSKFAPGDSFVSVVSQIRAAAEVWNGVATSDLRVQFGGITPAGAEQSGSGIDVVFDDDIDPTLIARGGVTTKADVGYFRTGGFIPIIRSRVALRKDLSLNAASYSDQFFLTLVHEFGHALGLQHTLTSSVMSTQITRTTTKARPLGGDDIAGLSVLYGSGRFAGTTGSIQGRVTYSNNGQGVNLASVVAITPNGDAISSVSNPDGSYRIDGLPPGQYMLYVHPLPPALPGEVTSANINLPRDVSENTFPVGQAFDTVFFPGTQNLSQAAQIGVAIGAVADASFSVKPRAASAISSVQLYGYFGEIPVKGPPLLPGNPASIVMQGQGLVVNNQMAAGLTANLLGETGIYSGPTIYQSGYLLFYVSHTAHLGARHLVLSLNNDLYVLPSAMTVVQSKPPAVSAVMPGFDENGNRAAIISGDNLSASTRILFDGATATISRAGNGALVVTPPPANSNYTAHVVALNGDGQTSAFALGSAPPPPFGYDSAATPSINVTSESLPAGTDGMIEITGFNTNFVDGQTQVGFGSSDIAVRRQWVVGTNRLLINVSVSGNAPFAAPTTVTVANGLALVSQPIPFQIVPPGPRQITLRAPVVSQVTGLAGVPAGGIAVLSVANLPTSATGLVLTVQGQQTPILSSADGRITFPVPTGLGVGAAVVRLSTAEGDSIPAIAMQVDAPPPVILGASSASGSLDAAHAAQAGETITLFVSGLANGVSQATPSAIRVMVGGVEQNGIAISPSPFGNSEIQFVLSPATPAGEQQITLTAGTRVSSSFSITVR